MPENDHDWVHQNYVCLLKKPIELYHSTVYFAVFLISLQIFANAMETADCVHDTKCMM